MQFTVTSWNINSIRARKDQLRPCFESTEFDVLCLQELKCTEQEFPHDVVAELGLHSAIHGEKQYNGVAILSKEKPLQFRTDLLPAMYGSRLIEAEFEKATVWSVYVTNGREVGHEMYHTKLAFLGELRSAIVDYQSRNSKPLIIAGDFNIAPDNSDVYDPIAWKGKILCSDAERHCLKEITDCGFIDCQKVITPITDEYTWWDYRMAGFSKNLGLRIDLLLASKSLEQQLAGVRVHRDIRMLEKPSDHCPVSSTFRL